LISSSGDLAMKFAKKLDFILSHNLSMGLKSGEIGRQVFRLYMVPI